jgi:hypothetical protein
MPLIDTVKQMQAQGLTDEQITQQLKEQGFQPLEIKQALDQAKIKAAVSGNAEAQNQKDQAFASVYAQQTSPAQQPAQETAGQPLQPSVMQTPAEQQALQPQPETPTEQQAEPTPQTEETPEYIYPTPQAYPEQAYQEYQPYQAASSETMTEIAEQIAEEKLNKTKKELLALTTFKATAERKIENIDKRVKKIEDMIDKLQATILGKIGSYGETMQDIRKEMEMMQESFSKALPSLIKKEKRTKKPAIKKKTKSKKKSSGIEHYLRR